MWEKYEIIPIEFFVQNLIPLMINLCEQEMIKNYLFLILKSTKIGARHNDSIKQSEECQTTKEKFNGGFPSILNLIPTRYYQIN